MAVAAAPRATPARAAGGGEQDGLGQELDADVAPGGTASIDRYSVGTLRDDLARFMFLLGETDGEGLFSPRTAELTEPAVFPAPDAG
jgi:hypothetical protein